MRDDHSSRPVIAHRLQQPTRKLRRAVFFEQRTRHASVLGRFPIWPCSVRGFACHLPYSRRGALLPHLFTLTYRRARLTKPVSLEKELARHCSTRATPPGQPDTPAAVYFLCH